MRLFIMINREPFLSLNLTELLSSEQEVPCKNEKAPTTFVIEASLLKGGGYLLSRIALQYHRRKWA